MIEKIELRKITIVSPCFNEVDNIDELLVRISSVMSTLPYLYDVILIDNRSTDGTRQKIREIAKANPQIKAIFNSRNFGHIRSPYHALLQTDSDATILISSDLQDPPELIADFITEWEKGFLTVLAVKPKSDERKLMFGLRKLYYKLVNSIAEVQPIANATGAGLFDRKVIQILREIDDPYPYFRGLLSEIGFPIAKVEFRQPRRQRGVTKNNLYTLLDIGLLGITNHSKVPLRLMVITGFISSLISLLVAFGFFIAKICWWNSFELGIAPLLIGLFLFASIQLMSLGLLGEYVGSIHTQVRKMPLVVEQERINF